MADRAIADVRRTIRLAQIRCLPFEELIGRLGSLVSDPDSSEIVYAVIESSRNPEQDEALALVICHLLEAAVKLSSQKRAWLERRIARILPILPPHISMPIARECLSHRRKGRRTIGFRSLSANVLEDDWSQFFMERYEETQDDRFLKEMAKHPLRLSSTDLHRLLEAFAGDEYWQMRTVEAALKQDELTALPIAISHPRAFVWAVGRLGVTRLVPEIAQCLKNTNDKLGLIGLVAWAYGKLGACDRLEALAPILDDLEEEYGLTSNN